MASTPATRLCQKAARSGAPGKIPAIPTTAIGSVATRQPPRRFRRAAHITTTCGVRCARPQLGQRGRHPRVGVDQADAAALRTRAPARARPCRSPAHGPQSIATTRQPGAAAGPPGEGVERVVGGRVVDLAGVAEPPRHAGEEQDEPAARRTASAMTPAGPTLVSNTRANDSGVLSRISLSSRTPAPWTTPSSRPALLADLGESGGQRVRVAHVERVVADEGGVRRQRGERRPDLAVGQRPGRGGLDVGGTRVLAPADDRLAHGHLVGRAGQVGRLGAGQRRAADQLDAAAGGAGQLDGEPAADAPGAAGDDDDRAGTEVAVLADPRLDAGVGVQRPGDGRQRPAPAGRRPTSVGAPGVRSSASTWAATSSAPAAGSTSTSRDSTSASSRANVRTMPCAAAGRRGDVGVARRPAVTEQRRPAR